jgi:hypothetical protein
MYQKFKLSKTNEKNRNPLCNNWMNLLNLTQWGKINVKKYTPNFLTYDLWPTTKFLYPVILFLILKKMVISKDKHCPFSTWYVLQEDKSWYLVYQHSLERAWPDGMLFLLLTKHSGYLPWFSFIGRFADSKNIDLLYIFF